MIKLAIHCIFIGSWQFVAHLSEVGNPLRIDWKLTIHCTFIVSWQFIAHIFEVSYSLHIYWIHIHWKLPIASFKVRSVYSSKFHSEMISFIVRFVHFSTFHSEIRPTSYEQRIANFQSICNELPTSNKYATNCQLLINMQRITNFQ